MGALRKSIIRVWRLGAEAEGGWEAMVPPEPVGDPRVGDSTIANERRHRGKGTSDWTRRPRASCTLAAISQAGKRLKDFPVETNGQALVEAIRLIPGRKHLVNVSRW
jgi:hypothetical protein